MDKVLNKGAVALKKWRAAQKPKPASQEAVAELVEVKQPTVARWELGVWLPNAKARGKLHSECGIGWPLWDELVTA